MSATAARPGPSSLARPQRRRGPVAHTLATMLRQQLVVAAWAWSLIAVAAVVLPLLIARAGHVDMSVLAFAWQVGIWAPFSMHIGLVASYLPVHVASGMTRRSYVRSAGMTVVLVGVLFAALLSAGLAIERLWYGAQGWEWAYRAGGMGAVGDVTTAGDLGLVLVYSAIAYTIAGLSGQLVGVTFYRGGGWVGTLTLPLTVGPLLLVIGLVGGGTGPVPVDGWFDAAPGTVPVVFVVGVALAVGAVLAAALRMQVVRVALSSAPS